MLCKKCGSKLPDDALFCSECGEPIEAPATEEVAQESINEAVAEAEAQSEVSEQDYQFTEVEFDEPVKKPKNLLAVIIAAVAVVACAVLVILNFSNISGFFIKTFGSDEDYFKYVEKKAFDSYTDEITEYYGTVMQNTDTDGAAEMQVKFNVSDDVIELAETALGAGEEVKLDFLKNIVFDMNINVKDNVGQLGAILSVDNQQLFNLDTIADIDKQEVLVGILNLSDKYMKLGAEDVDYTTDEAANILADPELQKVLPSEKELDKLLDKYLKIAIDNLDDVSKDTETVEIDDVKQKLTVLEFELDYRAVMKVSEAILEELKEDKQVEKIINDVAKYLEDEDLIDDADEIYDEFDYAIDDALDIIDEADFDNETILTLTDYVNSKHEIVGRKLEVGDEEIFSYITVRKGKNFATEVDIANSVKLEGGGTDKSDIVNGEFTFEAEDIDIGKITLKDFDTKKAEDGYLNGSIRLTPSKELLEEMGLDASGTAILSALAEPSLELSFASDKNTSAVDINLLAKGDVLFGISMTAKEKKATAVSKPADDKIISSENADEWLESVDLDKLIEALKKTSIPEALIDVIDGAMNPSYDYGYGYDDDYDYDYSYDYGYGDSYSY